MGLLKIPASANNAAVTQSRVTRFIHCLLVLLCSVGTHDMFGFTDWSLMAINSHNHTNRITLFAVNQTISALS